MLWFQPENMHCEAVCPICRAPATNPPYEDQIWRIEQSLSAKWEANIVQLDEGKHSGTQMHGKCEYLRHGCDACCHQRVDLY